MQAYNPYSPPVTRQAAPKRRRRSELPRDWWKFRLRTAAGIGLAMTVFGFNFGPRGLLIFGALGFPVGMVVTTLVSSLAVFVAEKPLTSDRIAFLGGICGFLSGIACLLIGIASLPVPEIGWNIYAVTGILFTFAFFGSPGAVGGWVGSMSWSEPAERKRIRETVARLRQRKPLTRRTKRVAS